MFETPSFGKIILCRVSMVIAIKVATKKEGKMKIKKKVVCTILCMLLVSVAFTQESVAREKLDLNVSVGYSPGWLLESKYIGTSFSLLGFSAKVAYIPLKRDFGNIGVEFAAAWFGMNTKLTERTLITNAIPLTINFVYQYRFNNRLMLDSHVGLGLSILNFQFDYGNSNLSPSLMELGFSINAGLALQLAIAKDFYTEVGMDYIMVLPKNVMIQMLLPSVSVGYEF